MVVCEHVPVSPGIIIGTGVNDEVNGKSCNALDLCPELWDSPIAGSRAYEPFMNYVRQQRPCMLLTETRPFLTYMIHSSKPQILKIPKHDQTKTDEKQKLKIANTPVHCITIAAHKMSISEIKQI